MLPERAYTLTDGSGILVGGGADDFCGDSYGVGELRFQHGNSDEPDRSFQPDGQLRLQPIRDQAHTTTSPTGVTVSKTYNDTTMTVTTTTSYTENFVTKTLTESETYNGWMQVKQAFSRTKAGRSTPVITRPGARSITNPFAAGGNPVLRRRFSTTRSGAAERGNIS